MNEANQIQPNKDTERYPLLPYSQLVWDMLKTDKHVYTFRSRAKIEQTAGRAERIARALRTAILNHPVFSMRVNEQGMQYFEELQNPLHGPFHDVDIEEKDNYIELTLTSNRILGDAISGLVMTEDFIRAYTGLPLEEDRYLEYLKQTEEHKLTERYSASKQWLEATFDRLTAPVHPTLDYPLIDSTGWKEGLLTDDWNDLQEAVYHTCSEQMVTLTGLVSLATALAMMDYNGTDCAALTWAYDGRETTMEQRICGSLHRDIPLLISRSKEQGTRSKEQRLALLKQVRTAIRQGIAHSTYPYTLVKPHSEVWNYAVNVLQQPQQTDILQHMPFAIEALEDLGRQTAYALLDIEIYEENEMLTITYRYSASHYKRESMERFAALVRKNAEWLIGE